MAGFTAKKKKKTTFWDPVYSRDYAEIQKWSEGLTIADITAN